MPGINLRPEWVLREIVQFTPNIINQTVVFNHLLTTISNFFNTQACQANNSNIQEKQPNSSEPQTQFLFGQIIEYYLESVQQNTNIKRMYDELKEKQGWQNEANIYFKKKLRSYHISNHPHFYLFVGKKIKIIEQSWRIHFLIFPKTISGTYLFYIVQIQNIQIKFKEGPIALTPLFKLFIFVQISDEASFVAQFQAISGCETGIVLGSFGIIQQNYDQQQITRMEDQQTCLFQFKITPTKIISPKSGSQKSILIKVGNKQGKCKVLGQSIQISTEVLYSKSSRKFSPIKGIVKVYDLNPNGTEMILCVGAFNTQQLLSQKQKTINLEKDVGPCKIFLTIHTKNLTFQLRQNVNQVQPKQPTNMSMKINLGNSKTQLPNIERKFLKSPRVSESDCPTPYIMDDSCDFLEQQRHERCSQASDEVRFNQKEALGLELVEQRRKNKVLQEKLEKSNIKIQLLRKNISQKNSEMKTYYQNFKNFTVGLETDSKGQYIFEMNQKKRQVSLKYKANIKFKEIFEEFIAFMIRKMTQNSALTSSQRTIEDEAEVNRILSKIQNYDQQKKRGCEENYKLSTQINNLKNQISQKTIELQAKDSIIKKKIEEQVIAEDKIRKLMQEKKGLEGLNHYLQQRDAQMELIIGTKENTIQSLKKMVTDNNEEYEKLVKVVKNQQLQIQEMKEENANLLQTIESYRENYGQLKTAKDKALERQFKECLRWIDQQNHDEDLVLEQSTESYSETPNVTSIMKSIGEIENMPLEQISLIRKQVINVLKRLDEFVAKNS